MKYQFLEEIYIVFQQYHLKQENVLFSIIGCNFLYSLYPIYNMHVWGGVCRSLISIHICKQCNRLLAYIEYISIDCLILYILTLTDIDDCKCSPCLNQATCRDDVNGYKCSCREGFSGKNCETGR